MSEYMIIALEGDGRDFTAEARELDPDTGRLTAYAVLVRGVDSEEGSLRQLVNFCEIWGDPVITDFSEVTDWFIADSAFIGPADGASNLLTDLTPAEVVEMFHGEVLAN